MRTASEVLAAVVAVAASGCWGEGGWSQKPYYEVWASLGDYETDVAGTTIGIGVRSVSGMIDDDFLSALGQSLGSVELLDAAGKRVPSKVEVIAPSELAEHTSWCRGYGYYDGKDARCAVVAPDAPLSEGWYTLESGSELASLLTGSVADIGTGLTTTHFYVGSKPMIVAIALSTKGGLDGELKLSEDLVLTNLDEFVAVHEVGGPGRCLRPASYSGTSSAYLTCDFSIDKEIEVEVKPGLVSATGAPLQDLAGNTSFTFRLGPKEVVDAESGVSLRKWQLGNQF